MCDGDLSLSNLPPGHSRREKPLLDNVIPFDCMGNRLKIHRLNHRNAPVYHGHLPLTAHPVSIGMVVF